MSRSENNLHAVLKDCADAIRAKKQSSSLIVPRDFADEIAAINNIPGGKLVSFKDSDNITTIGTIGIKTGAINFIQFGAMKTGYSFVGWNTQPNASISNIVTPYTPTNDIILYPAFIAGKTMQLQGLGSSNYSDVSFNVEAEWPTSFEIIEDSYGNSFLRIPTIYRRVDEVVDNQITKVTYATAESTGFEPLPAFVKNDSTIRSYILIGVYQFTSTSQASSVSGTRATLSIGVARSLAKALGSGYQIMDWKMMQVWQVLCLARAKTINYNSGSGYASEMGMQHYNVGGWWIDGVCHNSQNCYIAYNPSKYTDNATDATDGYSKLSYSLPTNSGYEVQKLGYDANHPFANFPSAVVSNSSWNTYYCDGYYYSAISGPVVWSPGNADADCGLFFFGAYRGWSGAFGARLCWVDPDAEE